MSRYISVLIIIVILINESHSDSGIKGDDFIFVKGGTYEMGDRFNEGNLDEFPIHSVKIDDFYMDKFEVTAQEFCDMLNYAKAESLITYSTTIVDNKFGDPKLLIELWDSNCPIRIISADFFIFRGEPEYPVVEITWYGAAFYCNMKSRQEGLTELYDLSDWSCNFTGNGYRLPTEAEWEYAARGGINWMDNYRYSGSDDIDLVAWYHDNSDSTLHYGGLKMPNQLGIYDMSGNAFEWCNDWYGNTYYYECNLSGIADNPEGPLSGTQKVMRCGGWDWYPINSRVANRFQLDPLLSHKSYGFRIVKTTENTDPVESVYLQLPDSIYTTTVSKYSVYYKNVILSQTPDKYSFDVNCPVGYDEGNKYNLDSLESGIYNFSLEVRDSTGILLEADESQIIVTENSISHNDTLKILFIGNSLTYAGKYERFVKEMIEEESNCHVKLLGTRFYSSQDSIDGIFHEGRAGWTWANYCRNLDSPFVYGSYPGVDVKRYITEELNNEEPDIVTFGLGINDIFNINSSSIESIDLAINNIFANWNMGLVIDQFEDALPNAKIGITLIPVANERLEPWYILYGDSAKAWEYRKCQHRLVQRYIDQFELLNKPNFSVIPVYSNIDSYLGYPQDNALHPNDFGYQQIANSIYGWIKYQISQWMTEPKNITISYNEFSVNLSWEPSSGVYSYNIYRSIDPYTKFDKVGSTFETSFSDNNIFDSDKYFYKVTSDNNLKK